MVCYNMDWLDFPRDKSGKTSEYSGIGFLDGKLKDELLEKWKAYWPQTGNAPNWDAVIHCLPATLNTNLKDKCIVVEAKAHLSELESDCGATDLSKNMIGKAFESTRRRFQNKRK